MKVFKKVLLIRPDRIGDVILSTPALEAVRQANPQAKIHFLVKDPVQGVVSNNPHVDKVIVYKPASLHRGFFGVLKLARELESEKYDVAISLQADFSVSSAVYLARIPKRVGPYSKPFSYALYNEGVRQNRSNVELHESEYGLELVRKALGQASPSTKFFETKVVAGSDALLRAEKILSGVGLQKNKYAVIHPGMGGSALNWPVQDYEKLAQALVEKGVPVLLTGSASERGLLDSLKLPRFVGELSAESIQDLTALYSMARVVVAPSTGPLHIAVALGKPTVSFYPPIKVQSAKRWGPYFEKGFSQTKHYVLSPAVECKENFKCAGSACPNYFCMEKISVNEALESVMKLWGEVA